MWTIARVSRVSKIFSHLEKLSGQNSLLEEPRYFLYLKVSFLCTILFNSLVKKKLNYNKKWTIFLHSLLINKGRWV